MDNLDNILVENDYRLLPRSEFLALTGIPEGLKNRAENQNGAFALYDPNDDEDGFLLIGDDKIAMLKELRDHIDSQVYGE